jgi:hypothetical protein
MASPSEILAAGGILRAPEVVAAAQQAGLELASAATLLQMESGGGRNIYGHDDVPTGGAYVKGGEVTEANYRAYLAAVRAGKAGRQGVGPCQLTWSGYQDQADRLGGCWRWEINLRVGFTTLAALQGTHGRLEGFRAYNGTGAQARAYAAKATSRRDQWLASLRDAARPTLRQGDRGVDVERLQKALKVEPVSGWFGPLTVAAVRRFQAGHQLIVDGIAGPATWAVLDR